MLTSVIHHDGKVGSVILFAFFVVCCFLFQITFSGIKSMDQDVAKHFVGPDLYICYSKTCVKWPFSKRPKNGFQDRLSLNAGQKYCRMISFFRPSLSYQFSSRPLFVIFE